LKQYRRYALNFQGYANGAKNWEVSIED
jgi:hypothetical protein